LSSNFEIDDAIVLLLGAEVPGAASGEIKGITRLEKLIFLLERETKSKDEWLGEDAKFEPYNFGPFSQRVYQAVDLLSSAGLLNDSDSPATDDIDTWELRDNIGLEEGGDRRRDQYVTRDFKLTDLGWRYFRALEHELPSDSLAEVAEFKRRFAFLPLRQLVRYVYLRYAEFTTKSIIRDAVLGT